jgi:hypothetical protein
MKIDDETDGDAPLDTDSSSGPCPVGTQHREHIIHRVRETLVVRLYMAVSFQLSRPSSRLGILLVVGVTGLVVRQPCERPHRLGVKGKSASRSRQNNGAVSQDNESSWKDGHLPGVLGQVGLSDSHDASAS